MPTKASSKKHAVSRYSIVPSATALLKYIKQHKITYDMLDAKTRSQWAELLGLLDEIEEDNRKAKRNLAREAKAIVALAFRNGPIETVRSHLTDEEMQRIVKVAVDRVYEMVVERDWVPEEYEKTLRLADPYIAGWAGPEATILPKNDSAQRQTPPG